MTTLGSPRATHTDLAPGRTAGDLAPRLARSLALVLGASLTAWYTAVALARIGAPVELEWMEGGMVDHVRRVLEGQALYTAPTLAHTPYLYTPGYYVVAAAAAKVLGVGLPALRLVSFLASFVAFGALARLVWHETRSRWAAGVGAAALAACYGLGGFWFDVARVDSLFLAWTLLGLAAARAARRPAHGALAGVLFTLAVLTKQEALLAALACLPWLWSAGRRVAGAFLAALASTLGGAVLALQLASGGWFWFYAVDVPRSHPWVPEMWRGFWLDDLRPWWPTGVAIVLAACAGRRSWRRSTVVFVLPVLGSLLATAWAARLHSGGWDNVLLPAFAAAAIGLALAVHRAQQQRTAVATGAAFLAAVQLLLLWNVPTGQVPPRRAEAAAAELTSELAALRGPVFFPGHGGYLAEAGKPAGAQSAALADVLRGPRGAARDRLRSELGDAIEAQRFAAVIVESERGLSYLPRDFARFYRFERRLVPPGALLPVTGTPTEPAELWVPRVLNRPAGS